jgi:vacuolar-type H+-ATPase subunit H
VKVYRDAFPPPDLFYEPALPVLGQGMFPRLTRSLYAFILHELHRSAARPGSLSVGGTLKEVVKKIMETEAEVREQIERAHQEAQKIVRNAEARSREIAEESRQQAVRGGQQLVERLKREAEEERDRQVGRVKGGSPELMKQKEREIEEAVAQIIGLITGEHAG